VQDCDLTFGTQLKLFPRYTPSGRCIQALLLSETAKRKRRMLLKPEKAELFMTAEEFNLMWKWKKQISPINECFANDGYSIMQDHYYKKPNLGIDPVISDADYSDFKQFLKVQKISLTRKRNWL
jgi:carboxyl-terminal processing protease